MILGKTPLAKLALAKSPAVELAGEALYSSAITLGALSLASAATNETHGDASITLDGIALTFAGTVETFGAASITLATIVPSATATVDVFAQSSITLADLTLSSVLTVNDNYSASVPLDDVGFSASFFVGSALQAAITLDGLALLAEFTAPGPSLEASITLQDLVARTGDIDIELRSVARSSIGGGIANRASVTAGHQLRTQAGSQRMRAY